MMLHDFRRTAASRRTIGSVFAVTGPRFAQDVCRGLGFSRARHIRSASSWRGSIVTPGGAPVPPECVAANHARRRCIPLRSDDASRERPSSSRMRQGIKSYRNFVKGAEVAKANRSSTRSLSRMMQAPALMHADN